MSFCGSQFANPTASARLSQVVLTGAREGRLEPHLVLTGVDESLDRLILAHAEFGLRRPTPGDVGLEDAVCC